MGLEMTFIASIVVDILDHIASFPGLPCLQFLNFSLNFCLLQVIKNRRQGRLGNEAVYNTLKEY